MFGRSKKKLKPEEPKVTEDPELIDKPQTPKKPNKKVNKTRKPAKTAENTDIQNPQMHTDVKEAEKPFVGIKEYGSTSEIAERIDKEIAETKSALGEYLRQLYDVRAVAEKSKRLHEIVGKLAGKKESIEKTDQIEVNGLEVILDATVLNELTAIESVVKSHQQRLIALKKAQEALKILDQVGDTEGIKYLALEREGIPERILLKLS
jgi:ubiquitin